MLLFAMENCDYLIVAINSDGSVKRLKGEGRPKKPLEYRMADVRNFLRYHGKPHAIIPFEGSPDRLLMEIRPDVVIVGYDHDNGTQVIAMRGYGWKDGAPIKRIPVLVAPHIPGVSTTILLEEK